LGVRKEWSGRTAPATKRLNSAAGFRKKRFAIKDKLEGKIDLPSRFGESPRFRREISLSFRLCTLKVIAEDGRKPAPQRGVLVRRDRLWEDRLEQQWGLRTEIL
jgi:hypothetical protein